MAIDTPESGKELYNLLKSACKNEHPHVIFRDFCECAAIAIFNNKGDGQDLDKEERYLQIAEKYGPETMQKFKEALQKLVELMDDHLEDYLGPIYMDLAGKR